MYPLKIPQGKWIGLSYLLIGKKCIFDLMNLPLRTKNCFSIYYTPHGI